MPGDRTYNFVIRGKANVEHFLRDMRRRPAQASARRAHQELDHLFGYGPKPSWYKEFEGPPSYAD